MRQKYENLSDKERDAKRDEFKFQMEGFVTLSLDEKIVHLQEFVDSLK